MSRAKRLRLDTVRVIVDANVCVSAVLTGKGNPARILDHALGGGPYDFELYAPPQLFSKLQEVLPTAA